MATSEVYSQLTDGVVFGMNILTLAGFFLMGTGLNLNRHRRIRPLYAFLLMGVGTALVFAGLYTLPRPG
ncbi:MAG: hypothetical protein ACREFB_10825 [Stellaceae bacterium]